MVANNSAPYKGLAINMGVSGNENLTAQSMADHRTAAAIVKCAHHNRQPQETSSISHRQANGTFKVVKENDGYDHRPPGIILTGTTSAHQLLAKATGKLEITAVPIDPEIKPDFKAEQNGKLLNMTINPTTVFSITATIK